jgi:DNA modification methylase
VFGGANKHGANVKHGDRTTGRVAEKRKRGVPPRHSQYESSDQSGLDTVPRGAGRNKRNVWTVATRPFAEAHFATFPPGLIEPCILAGCPKGGTVLDPFGGAGTTGLVADRLGRDALLIELNPEYAAMARRRIASDAPLLADVS